MALVSKQVTSRRLRLTAERAPSRRHVPCCCNLLKHDVGSDLDPRLVPLTHGIQLFSFGV